MNDLEIKDIDKLKNLLVEFGVEFCRVDFETFSYIDIIKAGQLLSTAFVFTPDGKFSHNTD